MTTRRSVFLFAAITIALVSPFMAQNADCGDPLRLNGRDRGFAGFTLAADGAGNVFIAEIGTNVVRRMAPSGTMTVVAGNGSTSYTGDGGPAVATGFNRITAIAADAGGNLFIAETVEPRIRKVTPAGTVSTVAGTGRLRATGDGGPAIAASLCNPLSLAVDPSGNLYVSSGSGLLADAHLPGDYRVRKISSDGTINTVAGSGQPPRGLGSGLDPAPDGTSALRGGMNPAFVVADSSGNLFIHVRGSVRKVSSSGIITTVLATATPYGMAMDGVGNVFTTQLGSIVKINSNGTPTVIASYSGPANRGGGSALTVDGGGNIYFAENSRRIQKITSEGVISTVGQIP